MIISLKLWWNCCYSALICHNSFSFPPWTSSDFQSSVNQFASTYLCLFVCQECQMVKSTKRWDRLKTLANGLARSQSWVVSTAAAFEGKMGKETWVMSRKNSWPIDLGFVKSLAQHQNKKKLQLKNTGLTCCNTKTHSHQISTPVI